MGDLQLGTLVGGRFRLDRLLAAGGLSTVYLASDIITGERRALKTMPAEVARDLRRWQREVAIGRTIDSQHIVEILDAGTDPLPYIAMEYLEGEALNHHLERGPMPAAEVVTFFRQVAHALDKAHAKGIVHRDLKPSNLFVHRNRDGTTSAKVLDFGIAELVGRAGETTGATSVSGTPLYAAPELMVRGEIGHRADIWALGLIAFEMLTAHRFWLRDGESLDKLILAILKDKIPPAVARAAKLGVALPKAFDGFFAKCVARTPSDRFATAGEAATALASVFERTTRAAVSPLVPGGVGAAPPTIGWPTHATLLAARPELAEPKPTGPWGVLDDEIPASMRTHRAALQAFFATVGRGVRVTPEGILELTGLLSMNRPTFVCIRPDEAKTDVGRVGTLTFLTLTRPIEHYLEDLRKRLALSATARYLFIVIIDSSSLGNGVREKIVEYRKKFDAQVVPIHIAEIALAFQDGRIDRVFEEQVGSLHAPTDPFVSSDRFQARAHFGFGDAISSLIGHIQSPRTFVAVTGMPGTGKSWLLESARLDCLETKIIPFSCPPWANRTIGELCTALAETISPQQTKPKKALTGKTALDAAIERATKVTDPCKRVVALDDADHLIGLLSDASVDADTRRQARELWSSLGSMAMHPRLGVVVTAVRGHRLGESDIAGWHNPFAKLVHRLAVRLFLPHETREALSALALEAEVTFAADALDAIHEASGGNPNVARRIASRALSLARGVQAHPLGTLTVARTNVVAATRDLAAEGATFNHREVGALSKEERAVLHAIAWHRPKDAAELREHLPKIESLEACVRALDELRAIGFVQRIEDHERVRVPLLEAWARSNLEAAATETKNANARRIRLATVAIVVTLALAITWYTTRHSGLSNETKARLDPYFTFILGLPATIGLIAAYYESVLGGLKRFTARPESPKD